MMARMVTYILNLMLLYLVQHPVIGLIHWGIFIHQFIDGYSQLITGLCAHNNNCGQTVLIYFLFMVFYHIFFETIVLKIYLWLLVWKKILAVNSKAHISGGGKKTCISKCHKYEMHHRSVHNIRIEQLWIYITAQVGAMDWISIISTIFGLFIICFSTLSMCSWNFLHKVGTILSFKSKMAQTTHLLICLDLISLYRGSVEHSYPPPLMPHQCQKKS